MIDDTPSKEKNFDGFIHNKSDQSVFSILCKKNSIQSISAYECEWFYHNNERFWGHTINSPIIAKRDLKYNIFKRFYNRQLKTLRRLKQRSLMNKLIESYLKFGYNNSDSFIEAIGNGSISIRDILNKISPNNNNSIEEDPSNEEKGFLDFARGRSKGIKIQGIKNLMGTMGKMKDMNQKQ